MASTLCQMHQNGTATFCNSREGCCVILQPIITAAPVSGLDKTVDVVNYIIVLTLTLYDKVNVTLRCLCRIREILRPTNDVLLV